MSSDESSSVDVSSSGSETDTECAWISGNEHDTLLGSSSQNSYPENEKKDPKLENEARKKSKTKQPKLENEAPKTRNLSVL